VLSINAGPFYEENTDIGRITCPMWINSQRYISDLSNILSANLFSEIFRQNID
jgi:hypothetical protein